MFIPRIFGTAPIGRPESRRRRSPSSRRFALEPLETRMALSAGLAALDQALAEAHPRFFEAVHAMVAYENEESIAPPPAIADAAVAPAVGLVGMLEGAGVHLSSTPASPVNSSPPDPSEDVIALPPDSADLIDGLAASIGVLAQQFREGVPVSDLIDGVAEAAGSTPTEIRPAGVSALIQVGEAEVFTAQQDGVAVPTTLAASDSEWLPTAVGQVEAVASALRGQDVSYGFQGSGFDPGGPLDPDPDMPPVPPVLVSLGRFILRNMNAIYANYLAYFDTMPDLSASITDGLSPNGLGPIANATLGAVQEDPSTGLAGVGWTSYTPASGRGPALTQTSFTSGEGSSSTDESPEEPVSPASITAGEIPLDVLLSEPALATPDVSVDLPQVVDLIPAEDSSLALVATLWSVSSDPPSEPRDGDEPAGERAESAPSSDSPPPWATFVIGLDEAFERSRDACSQTLRDGPNRQEEATDDAALEGLERRCFIVPALDVTSQPDPAKGSSPFAGGAAIDRATTAGEPDSNRPVSCGSTGPEESVARPGPEGRPPHDATDGPSLPEGSAPLAWAASGSALIAGWFWARRRLRSGWGLGGIDHEDERRDGRGRSEPEGS
jgi:hypothetical protein